MSADFASVKDAKTVLLTTYKRDGTPVGTPVSIAFDGDRAFSAHTTRRGRPSACAATLTCSSHPRPCAASQPAPP
jgi:hypothetical protein